MTMVKHWYRSSKETVSTYGYIFKTHQGKVLVSLLQLTLL